VSRESVLRRRFTPSRQFLGERVRVHPSSTMTAIVLYPTASKEQLLEAWTGNPASTARNKLQPRHSPIRRRSTCAKWRLHMHQLQPRLYSKYKTWRGVVSNSISTIGGLRRPEGKSTCYWLKNPGVDITVTYLIFRSISQLEADPALFQVTTCQ